MKYEIAGGTLPALIVHLEAGETMISEIGARTWSKGPVETETSGAGGFGKAMGRLFSGESIFLSRYQAAGPAQIGFASSFPGKIMAFELQAGESIICQKKAFLCATGGVSLSAHVNKKVSSGLFGGEGFIMQQITGPGIAFVEIDGYCQEYVLGPGEEVVCDTGVLAVMDSTCSMNVRVVKGIKNKLFGGEGLVDTVISGPGRVYLQTMTIEKLAALIRPYMPTGN